MAMLGFLLIPLIFVLVAALKTFGINQEYERAVVFRLGRVTDPKGPGWYWLIPFIDRAVRVDTRTVTIALDTQETVTRDGVAVRVNAVLWFRATNPVRVLTVVEEWQRAVLQAAETGLRDSIGQSDLDQLLKDRTAINLRLMGMLTSAVEQWGVAIDAVEIKDLDIPENMQRAIGARPRRSARSARGSSRPRASRRRRRSSPTPRGRSRPAPARSSCAGCRRSPRSAPSTTAR